jgi:hypothetical protein
VNDIRDLGARYAEAWTSHAREAVAERLLSGDRLVRESLGRYDAVEHDRQVAGHMTAPARSASTAAVVRA